jgi:hypothetical protein
MPVSTTLPVMAGLAILGVALGVGFGKSAVADINPAYFSKAEDSFHGDLVPNRGPDWAPVHQADYRAAQQPVVFGDLGTGCVGCRDYPVEYVPRHDPAVDRYVEGGTLPEPAQAAVAEAAPAPDPDRERIQRYASFPVSSDEKPVEVAEAPQEEAASPTGL